MRVVTIKTCHGIETLVQLPNGAVVSLKDLRAEAVRLHEQMVIAKTVELLTAAQLR